MAQDKPTKPVPDASSTEVQDDVSRRDARDMRRMGKIQELRRNFRSLSTLGFTICAMGTWEILYLQNAQSLIDGGKAGMFWTYVWVYTGQAFIVASLAEMASMAPTAGGQYHWVSEFAPRSAQRILSYISGWLSMLGWQLAATSVASLNANLILAIATTNDPTFEVMPYMNTLLMMAIIIASGLLNMFGVRILPAFEGAFAFLHVGCFVLVLAVLWSLAPRCSAAEVFLGPTDNNVAGMQWQSIGLALMVGQAPALFTVQGSDSVAHMSEEVKDAARVVPQSMMVAFGANIPISFGLLVTYLFTLGDVSEALAAQPSFPFIYGVSNAVSRAGTVGITFVMLLLTFMIGISVTASAARQTFAFARDHGVPFSSWIGHISGQWRSPINAVVVTCGFTTVMSLIYLGSAVAFNAFVSVSVLALMATYSISICCVLIKRIRASRGGPSLPKSPFSLGRYGVFVNSVALMFSVYSFFWCFWPISNTSDPELFNWAVAIFGGVCVVSAATYLIVARKKYDGPVAKVLCEDEL